MEKYQKKPNSRGKTIAINSIAMFVRTFVTLLITLYTSRVTLNILGVESFGIYNLVAGVVLFLSFFSGPLTKMSVRFLSYEQSQPQGKDLSQVFSACFSLHLGLVLIVVILGFLVGYSIVSSLNIPHERLGIVIIVFYLSLFTLAFHVIKIPYESLLLSYEKMTHYAVLSILDSVFKLSGVLALVWLVTIDALLAYGWMLCLESILIFVLTLIISKRVCPKYKIIKPEKKTLNKMSSFAGWSMMGGSSDVITQSSFNMLINIFYGVIVNAALGIMNQVQSALSKFLSSFSMAYNPQVIKAYAEHKLDDMSTLISSASKLSFLLLSMPAFPLFFNMDFVLKLWLGDVPEYAGDFCRVAVVIILIDSITSVYNTSITATGNIRNYQISISLSFIFDLLISFALLKLGVLPTIVIVSRVFTRGLINMIIGLYFMKIKISFNVHNYAKCAILPIAVYAVCSVLYFLMLCYLLDSELSQLLVSIFSFVPISCAFIYFFFLNKKEQAIVDSIVKRK